MGKFEHIALGILLIGLPVFLAIRCKFLGFLLGLIGVWGVYGIITQLLLLDAPALSSADSSFMFLADGAAFMAIWLAIFGVKALVIRALKWKKKNGGP